jgi:hypothetical protein
VGPTAPAWSGVAPRVRAEIVRPKRRGFQAYRSFFKRDLLSTVTNARRASSSLDSPEGGRVSRFAVYILRAKPQCQVGYRQAIDFHPPGLPTLHQVTSRKRTAADEISGE